MADTPIPISDISDPGQIRIKLLSSGKEVHAPMAAVASASIHGATAKTTPVDADEFPIADSAASYAVKKITWANIKATLKTYFDTLYQPLAATLTSWAAITRATGFDAFAATASSANLRTLLTDETGTGAAVFAGAPTITGVPIFSGIPSLTGGALTFPATQVPSAGANDMDDYEELTYTPSITAVSGTFTTVSATGSYTKVGRLVSVQMTITITTVGTAAGGVKATLPFTANATGGWVLAGRENASTGKMLQGLIAASGTIVTIFNYDNTAPIGAGFSLIVSGDYWV